ncbi:MAG: PA0069 family radical SAM protein [Phycisphaerales bacterium]
MVAQNPQPQQNRTVSLKQAAMFERLRAPLQTSPHGAQDVSGLADAALLGLLKGRGAGINPANRFESTSLVAEGEWLESVRCEQLAAQPTEAIRRGIDTHIFDDDSKSVLNKVESPDLPFSVTLNPYRGCEHGCIYCYARPGHEYLGLSSGLDFETKIFAKRDVATLLRKELSKPSWIQKDENGEPVVQPIMMAGVTDVYQPIEAELGLTRQCLQVMLDTRQPVTMITKSKLILRDIDILKELAAKNLVRVAISVTTLDNQLASIMEPRAAAPRGRIDVIRTLASAGVPVMVMTAPIIPGLNDSEIPSLLREASRAGAIGAGYVLLRLPFQIKAIFIEWLQRHFPQRAAKIEALIRDTREGELYQSKFFERGRGTGALADQIRVTFEVFRKKYKLAARMPVLDTKSFRALSGRDVVGQLGLF